MVKEDSSRRPKSGGKTDFKTHFQTKYEEWEKKAAGDQQKDDVSMGTVKTEAKEEDREETNPLPQKPETVFGFKNEIKSMENFLLDQKVYKEFKSLVILGEYGVGKTTLCKMIFNKEEVKSVYAPRIWVSMHSTEPKDGLNGKICVVKKILKGLGVEEEMLKSIHDQAEDEYKTKEETGENYGETALGKELAALLYALHLNLRWKKYLIVIDDVRKDDNWNEKLDEIPEEDEKWGTHVSDGFPKGSGGRVIYTTRDEKVAKKLVAEDHEIHRLWPLTDSLSVWNIYNASYTEDNETREPPRNDKKCIDELMNKSRGLPLAARLLAKLDPVFLDDEKPAEDSTQETAGTGNQEDSTQGTAETGNQDNQTST